MQNKILDDLIKFFSKLPSLGPRSARRVVLYLLNNKENIMAPLLNAMDEGYTKIKHCPICGNLTTNEICDICADETRNKEIICVVENIADLWAIENTMIYKGQYHILGGTLSATEGRGPDDINIEGLVNKIKNAQNIKEVILAIKPSVEGETTALYIKKMLENTDVVVTKIAYGIPMGADIDYIDPMTLSIAMEGRMKIS